MKFRNKYYLIVLMAIIGCVDVFAASAEHTYEKSPAGPIAGLIFKATLPDDGTAAGAREITFVPTHHAQPLSEFTAEFQNEVCRARAFVGERIFGDVAIIHPVGEELSSYIGADGTFDLAKFNANAGRDGVYAFEASYTDDEGRPAKAYSIAIAGSDEMRLLVDKQSRKDLTIINLSRVLRYAGAEKLKTLDGALSDAPTWNLSHNPEVAANLERLFGGLYAQMQQFDLHRHAGHFRNIYTMSPVMVLGLYYLMDTSSSKGVHSQISGMDRGISKMYKDDGKTLLAVESMEDVLSFIDFRRPFDEVRDAFDFIGQVREDSEVIPYSTTLKDMHESNKRSASIKGSSILDAANPKRNQHWMAQYEGLLHTYGDILCAHGSNHFPGREGLWALGQERGWKWFVRNWTTGAYDPFVYTWNGEHPFTTLDGGPLEI